MSVRMSEHDVVRVSTNATNDLNLPVVLVAPDVLNRGVFARTIWVNDVVGNTGSLFNRVGPVLNPDVFAVLLVTPAGDIAHGIHVVGAYSPAILIEHNPVVNQ